LINTREEQNERQRFHQQQKRALTEKIFIVPCCGNLHFPAVCSQSHFPEQPSNGLGYRDTTTKTVTC